MYYMLLILVRTNERQKNKMFLLTLLKLEVTRVGYDRLMLES